MNSAKQCVTSSNCTFSWNLDLCMEDIFLVTLDDTKTNGDCEKISESSLRLSFVFNDFLFFKLIFLKFLLRMIQFIFLLFYVIILYALLVIGIGILKCGIGWLFTTLLNHMVAICLKKISKKVYFRLPQKWHFFRILVLHYEHFWFQKWPLNISENCMVYYFIYLKCLQHFMIFLSSAVHLALSTLKNNQILQKIWRKWR